jgi:hypothetical protein
LLEFAIRVLEFAIHIFEALCPVSGVGDGHRAKACRPIWDEGAHA